MLSAHRADELSWGRRERIWKLRHPRAYEFACARHTKLGKERVETSALCVEDLRLAGNLPELTLEGAERLLSRAIDELLLAIPRLCFVRSVRLQPGGDLSAQFARERGVVVERVLETSCKVHLSGANFWESVEEALWERGGTMLNHTRKAAP